MIREDPALDASFLPPSPRRNGPSVTAVGDVAAAKGCEVLHLRVAELRQMFNAMDPAPFHERDLDPRAYEYIVEWGRELPGDRPLGLAVELTREAATPETAAMLREAVHEHFRERALATRRQLRQLFRIGRISLVIGLTFLAFALASGEFLASLISKDSYAYLLKETLVIGGWVALWRPIEIFLYDWWPIRAEARLRERMSRMQVWLQGAPAAAEGA